MKRIVFLAAIMVLSCATANAQLGGLLEKAAKKTSQKITKKLTDKAEEAIEKEIDKKVDQTMDSKMDTKKQATSNEVKTYADLLLQMPELPTVDQYIKYKEAELNEQTLKMMTSKVSTFNLKVVGLIGQASTGVGDQALDSAQATEMAYRYAEMTTGLTKEEIDKLSTMSDEEQQAYLMAHYRQGTAESAILKESEEVAKLMEPLQPLVDKWTAAGDKADAILTDADNQCKTIYNKYSAKLKTANGKERNNLLLQYYGEMLPIQHKAVVASMQIRQEEQLPIAEEIEKKMVPIRAQNPGAITQLLSYPKLTAMQYFALPSRLTEITEY